MYFLELWLNLSVYIFKRSSKKKIGVERINQASKLTGTEVNNIVDVAVNCIQIVDQILRQSSRSTLSTPCREYDAKVLQHWPERCDRSTLKTEWMADQVKSSFSDSLTEMQTTGFRENFFVRDVVQPIDVECSANHLPMTGIEHVLRRRTNGEGFQCISFYRFDGRFEKFNFQCIWCCRMKHRT